MKVYIASKFTSKEEVRNLQKHLISLGHKITHDWTKHEDKRPFEKNKDIAEKYAKEDIEGVRNADIFIALVENSEGSIGMHTEIGCAISSFLEKGSPKVYILGNKFDALFYFHPCVKRINEISEALN